MLSFGIKTSKNANLYFEIPRAYEAFNLTVAVNNAINYSSSLHNPLYTHCNSQLIFIYFSYMTNALFNNSIYLFKQTR
jgi:hypothetical protein